MKKMFTTTLVIITTSVFTVKNTQGCDFCENYDSWVKEELEARTAIAEINDPAILVEIAKTNVNFNMWRFAIEKLDNQTLLLEIVRNGVVDEARGWAVYKLESQEFLTEFAKNDESASVRKAAIDKLVRIQPVLEKPEAAQPIDETPQEQPEKTSSNKTLLGFVFITLLAILGSVFI